MDTSASRWRQLTLAQVCLLLWLLLMGPLLWLVNSRLGTAVGIGIILVWLIVGVAAVYLYISGNVPDAANVLITATSITPLPIEISVITVAFRAVPLIPDY